MNTELMLKNLPEERISQIRAQYYLYRNIIHTEQWCTIYKTIC